MSSAACVLLVVFLAQATLLGVTLARRDGTGTSNTDSGSSSGNCFPSEAMIVVEGKGAVRMADLSYGDKVLAVDKATGAKVSREVYLFGHREQDVQAQYVGIKLATGQSLKLTPFHYLPVCVESCSMQGFSAGSFKGVATYAADVKVGDVLMVNSNASSDNVGLSTVVQISMSKGVGAFNPYVRGAYLVVDGVVVSPHSDWLFDSITPAGLRKYLPSVYECMLAPVHSLYQIVGPVYAEWLAHGLGLAEASSASYYGAGYLLVMGTTAAAVFAMSAVLWESKVQQNKQV
jgi:hypothetical protein